MRKPDPIKRSLSNLITHLRNRCLPWKSEEQEFLVEQNPSGYQHVIVQLVDFCGARHGYHQQYPRVTCLPQITQPVSA